jgi:hypothetical protein
MTIFSGLLFAPGINGLARESGGWNLHSFRFRS